VSRLVGCLHCRLQAAKTPLESYSVLLKTPAKPYSGLLKTRVPGVLPRVVQQEGWLYPQVIP